MDIESSPEALKQSTAPNIEKKCVSVKDDSKELSYMDKQKQFYASAYAPWTEEDDNRLKRLYVGGKSVDELMEIFGRNRGAIKSRLKKLGKRGIL